jgi:predicted MPP superfamily phosphohydrolase
LKLFIITGLICLTAMIGEILRELRCFRVTRYTVRSPKLAGLGRQRKLIFLSDLHNYRYGENNDALYDAIAKEKPDLILIGGDMLIRTDGNSYERTAEFLARLPKLCPVYHANGNHEQKLKERPKKYKQSYRDYKGRLLKAGVRFLENASVTVEWEEARLKITGLEIPMRGYERAARGQIRAEDLEKRIGRSGEAFEILMAHHPGHVKAYREWGADLILCGHYHGGVIGIPGIGGVIAPDFTPFPRYSGGCYREGDASVVVSRGLGVHSVPIRLFNPAEAVAVELAGPRG